MAAKSSIDRIKQNASLAQKTIETLKNELNVLNSTYNSLLLQQLRDENAKLLSAVDQAKRALVENEVKNGIKQIPIPTQISCVVEKSDISLETENRPKPVLEIGAAEKKEGKSKKEKKKQEPKEPPKDNLPVDVGRLDLRVARIEDVQKHPDADTLYVLQINCGENKPRTVCSGLVKYVPMEDLKNRFVVLLCNLKPVKMRGVTSEAMVMCASTSEAVEVLSPPPNCVIGDLVECEGYVRQPDSVMNPKKKIFETVAPDLHINDSLKACYKGIPFSVAGKGHITSQTLKNVAVK